MPEKFSISVFGLGKLGLPLACHLAEAGHQVIGVDTDTHLMIELERGQNPYKEPNLSEKFLAARSLVLTECAHQAVEASGISIVVVPTPSRAEGDFSLDNVRTAFRSIGTALRNIPRYHLVVLASTVNPGSFRNLLADLEATSGKRCGRDFGYCYNPQFIALGTVLKNLKVPDFVLIGQSDNDAGSILERLYVTNGIDSAIIHRTTVVDAEISKLAVNAFITTKISFANFLGMLCQNIPGSNVDEVTRVVGSDYRIGGAYLKAGTAFAGPCFPRDNQSLKFAAHSLGITAPVCDASIAQNSILNQAILEFILKSRITPKDSVGIVGLSYKPLTMITDHSTGDFLLSALRKEGVTVNAWDPLVTTQSDVCKSLKECIQISDVLVITHASLEVLQLPKTIEDLPDRPHTIIDCWRQFKPEDFPSGTAYRPFGIGETS